MGKVIVSVLVALAACVCHPASALEILITAPERDAVVSSVVEVRATLTAREGEDITPPLLQTLDGCQKPLVRVDEDTYRATVDTTALPNGHQTIMVYVTPTGIDACGEQNAKVPEVPIVVRNPYRFCWGDIHAHTSYSDGDSYPAEAYTHARDQAKLDFFAITDHLEFLTLDEYRDVMARADEFDEPNRFVALYGVETEVHEDGAAVGHINVYMSPTHIFPSEIDDFYRAIPLRALVGHFNHPEPVGVVRYNDFQGFRHAPSADASVAMVEVRTADEEACYIALLDSGWHVGAAGDQDKHDLTWGDGPTWTVVLARDVTRQSILDAFRSRRTYSTADRNLRLTFTLDSEDMGAQMARPAGDYLCEVALQDPDPDHVIERVDLFLNGKIIRSAQPNRTDFSWRERLEFPPGRHYCFTRVTQADGRSTWSSPIWVNGY